jgi:hypothetical protein
LGGIAFEPFNIVQVASNLKTSLGRDNKVDIDGKS